MKKQFLTFSLLLIGVILFSQPYNIGHKQYNFVDPARSRTIQTEVYYPAITAGDNVPFATGQFPVLVFGHGFVMTWDSYQWLWDSIVPRGYIMVFPRTEGSISPSHSAFGEDLRFLNNFLLNEGSNSSSDFYQHILGTSAIMGHSMGGGSSFLAAANNTNLTTLINFAAAETNPSAIAAASNVTVPSVVFYGLNDGVAPPANHQIPMYNALASSCKTRIGIIGGGHCYFADYNFNCSFGEGTTSPQPSITREQQHQIISQLLFPYLDFMLKGNATAEQIYYQRLNNMNTIVFERNCLMNNDIKLTRFLSPINGCGLTSSQIVSIVVKNNGINSASNIPLNLIVNGQTIASETYTGTIIPGDSITYTFSSAVNAGQPGTTYNFLAFSSYSVDEYVYNDSITATYINTSVALPISVNFTGFDGTNLATIFPGWKEAQGIVPAGSTSMWVNRNGVGGTTNTTAKVNMYSSPIREWILGPGFVCGPYTKLTFDVAVTDYNSTNADPDGMANGDSLIIYYSLDCGNTWNRLTAYGKNAGFTNNLQTKEIMLGQFANQGIAIAFQAFRQTSVANDYDLHLDNILIKNYYPFDLMAVEINKPIEQNCYGIEPVEVKIKNVGINTIDFAQTTASIQIIANGPNNFNQTVNLSGTLASNALTTVSLGSFDMSLPGSYTFIMNILFSNDNDTTNNLLIRTVTVNNPEISISGNTTICNGQNTILTANTSTFGLVNISKSFSGTVNIPDNNTTGITSTINLIGFNPSIIAGNALKKVIIDSLTHTYVGDLKIDLIAPNNSTINLINKRGSSGDNFIGTVLDPNASVNISTITSTQAPFTGTYTPEQPFNTLTGTINGDWKLKVSDLASGDVGILRKWSLVLEVNNYIVNYSWSTGDTIPSITISPNQTTTYSVTATDAKGCSTIANTTVHVEGSTHSLNLGPDIDICQGQSFTLDAGAGFTSYNWSTTETSQSIIVNTSGIYYVIANDACNTYYDTVQVTIHPLPSINLGNDVYTCVGNTITLEAGNFNNYLWSNNETTHQIDISSVQSGTQNISVTVTDNYGCQNYDEVLVVFNENPTPSLGIDTTVCFNDVITLNAGNYAQYLWSDNQTTSTITINTNTMNIGIYEYSVTVTDSNGCTGSDTINITIEICESINNLNNNELSIYPIPANDYIIVQLKEPEIIQIYSSDGRCLYQTNSAKQKNYISLENWATGVYYIKLPDKSIKTYKFVKL